MIDSISVPASGTVPDPSGQAAAHAMAAAAADAARTSATAAADTARRLPSADEVKRMQADFDKFAASNQPDATPSTAGGKSPETTEQTSRLSRRSTSIGRTGNLVPRNLST